MRPKGILVQAIICRSKDASQANFYVYECTQTKEISAVQYRNISLSQSRAKAQSFSESYVHMEFADPKTKEYVSERYDNCAPPPSPWWCATPPA
jgi:hypothetical protein